jgi:hypothetical protein
MQETMSNVLKKKKRGRHVLSVVVEGEEEDSGSLHRIVHEPVAGQKEGLADPLELDAGYMGVIELPGSSMSRTGSRERERGESSRPSTGGLERIDERVGL